MNNYEIMVSETLKNMGFTENTEAYQCILKAILLSISNTKFIDNPYTHLYPALAEEFSTTPSDVELKIGYAITSAWRNSNKDIWESTFGYSICKPTNIEFFGTIADNLR